MSSIVNGNSSSASCYIATAADNRECSALAIESSIGNGYLSFGDCGSFVPSDWTFVT
jgi:hypothetical protein